MQIKKLLIEAGILEERCYGAGCSVRKTWLGNPLALHLDHINGIGDDYELENLRLLCPNCHTQTSTYAGKNIPYVLARKALQASLV